MCTDKLLNDKINAGKLFKVGNYIQEYNDVLEISLPCKTIYQSSGLEVHVRQKHNDYLKYLTNISEIISNPDYIGNNPKETNSIE